MKIRLLMFLLIFTLVPLGAYAAVYKWKDENGKIHFTDSPDKVPLKYRKKENIDKRFNKKPREESALENAASGQPDFDPRPEIAKDKTSFTLKSWKGKKVKITGFKVGSWKKNPKGIKSKNPITYREGRNFGAVYKISKLESNDSLSIAFYIKAPNADPLARPVILGISSTITGDYENEIKTVSIMFEDAKSRNAMIPSEWYLEFKNENNVFRAQKIHVRQGLR